MIHVAIASVPQRADNLVGLFEDLDRQTALPQTVTVFLNGWTPQERAQLETRLSGTPRPYVYRFDHSEAPRGQGIRWRYLSDIPSHEGDIGVVIDDDFRITHKYIKLTTDPLSRPDVGMVSWTGRPRYRRYGYHGFEALPVEVSLLIAGGGTSAVRLTALRGLQEHVLAEEMLRFGGDDECLVSLYCWQQHLNIVRPAGTLPFRSVDELQDAPTASHLLHGDSWDLRRDTLIQEYDWK